ncbi:hypothetical protein E2C01_048162 [Portunus trituberculatus]|uniref:Uncharacterized protein n=1 Tax=Portunus trituberculatus TaxID=210409 RepID=A0A5B7G5P4_PORTR|nr:hypothetical protein [Portunus trituberculatus]
MWSFSHEDVQGHESKVEIILLLVNRFWWTTSPCRAHVMTQEQTQRGVSSALPVTMLQEDDGDLLGRRLFHTSPALVVAVVTPSGG